MPTDPSVPITDGYLATRFNHHPPFGDQAERYSAIRAKCLELAKFIRDRTPRCEEQERSLDALDQVMFLANAAIARHERPAAAASARPPA